MLFRAVRIQEFAGNIHDRLAIPGHHKALFLGDSGNNGRLKVLFCGKRQEFLYVLIGNHHCHTLLRFGDGKLGAVKAVVLLANSIQIDGQAVGKLTDGNGYTARTEVIAALDKARDVGVAEKSLDLALLGRLLLNL